MFQQSDNHLENKNGAPKPKQNVFNSRFISRCLIKIYSNLVTIKARVIFSDSQ